MSPVNRVLNTERRSSGSHTVQATQKNRSCSQSFTFICLHLGYLNGCGPLPQSIHHSSSIKSLPARHVPQTSGLGPRCLRRAWRDNGLGGSVPSGLYLLAPLDALHDLHIRDRLLRSHISSSVQPFSLHHDVGSLWSRVAERGVFLTKKFISLSQPGYVHPSPSRSRSSLTRTCRLIFTFMSI